MPKKRGFGQFADLRVGVGDWRKEDGVFEMANTPMHTMIQLLRPHVPEKTRRTGEEGHVKAKVCIYIFLTKQLIHKLISIVTRFIKIPVALNNFLTSENC